MKCVIEFDADNAATVQHCVVVLKQMRGVTKLEITKFLSKDKTRNWSVDLPYRTYVSCREPRLSFSISEKS